VAISWGDYFNTLLRGVGINLPVFLTTGNRTALLSATPEVHGLLGTAPRLLGVPILVNLPAFGIVMVITWLLLRGARESSTVNTAMVIIKLSRGHRVLRLHRLRCDFDGGGGDAQSAAYRDLAVAGRASRR
jgi:amino acid transporter